MSKIRIAVLMGGVSSERAISLSTGRQILAALDPQRYEARAFDPAALRGAEAPAIEAGAEGVPREPGADLAPMSLQDLAGGLAHTRPDVVFIALHGKGGEDGAIQGMLDVLGIPYTGSGVLASALAMDKSMTKRVLRSHGIPVPDEVAVRRARRPADAEVDAQIAAGIGYPAIVKPNEGGSTIGCRIVRSGADLGGALDEALGQDAMAIIEPLLAGVEITAGVLGNDEPEVLPLIEIVARGGFYDFEAKYAPGGSTHIIPARISDAAAERARRYAADAHLALGCRGMCRVDMMVVGDEPVVLEVNTIPGMTPTSLLPDAARAAGIGFGELLDRLVHDALEGRS